MTISYPNGVIDQLRARGKRFREEEHTPLPHRERPARIPPDAARVLRGRLDEIRAEAGALAQSADAALAGLHAARTRLGAAGISPALARALALSAELNAAWSLVEDAVTRGLSASEMNALQSALSDAATRLDALRAPSQALSEAIEEALDVTRQEAAAAAAPAAGELLQRAYRLAERTQAQVSGRLPALKGCQERGARELYEGARAAERMCAETVRELRVKLEAPAPSIRGEDAAYLMRLAEDASARAIQQTDALIALCQPDVEARSDQLRLESELDRGKRARIALQGVATEIGQTLKIAKKLAGDTENPAIQRSYHRVQTHAARVRQWVSEGLAASEQLSSERDYLRAHTLATRAERNAEEAREALPDLQAALDALRGALSASPAPPAAEGATAVLFEATQLADADLHARTVVSARTPEGNLAVLPPDPGPISAARPPRAKENPVVAKPKVPPRALRGRLARLAALLGLGGGVMALVVGGGGYWYLSRDLPSIEALQAYQPPTVTEVYDAKGRMLGEIYEERRYVRPLDEIPKHVQNAFIAAEDANFWDHGGVDWFGIVRAFGRNAVEGRMAQGASTITQQVTRNFLLTREKKITRKLKEMILALRIENTYDKEHILYLYLNQIYLGSQAYGVEAAARTYFDKSVADITVAEAAIMAGLPQRPSDYSPHRRWSKARARQKYVLHQMVRNGFITKDEEKAALDEHVRVVERHNVFLETAPHFTEHVRRHVVERYGEQKVLHEGLKVFTTCDLDLQTVGQRAVIDGVFEHDQRMGFRREGVKTLATEEIAAQRDQTELALKEAWVVEQDAARRIPLPERSTLKSGANYDGAVVLEVTKGWARIGLGSHEGLIPLAWSTWVYTPDANRSWRSRAQTDLTERVDSDGDGKKEGGILRVGDVVKVKVEALSTRDSSVAKVFSNTPGAQEALVALRLWQEPEVEGALFGMDLETGAVRVMVGGADFERSQLNRATQAKRQVGSTFKPIVYGAAIEAKRITSATMVADAPLAFAATTADFIWKPANYGDDYLGNITVRRALSMSRNTCTIRVLESTDPGMNRDLVYRFARKLGIGGPPLHTLAEDYVPTPMTDDLCPWIRETPKSTICMDRYPAKDPNLTNTAHRAQMKPDDKYWCRACDMSIALGSASLSMDELVRAYSAFATSGTLVEPYYIERVEDRNGAILEAHEVKPHPQVIDPGVASIMRWLLRSVVAEGTGGPANKLGLELGGKTGTTNDEKDAWFVGFSKGYIASAWVGFDQPRPLGTSSTGGRTALPIWMALFEVAVPKSENRPFRYDGDLDWAQIDETTGRRVTSGGRDYPFLPGTLPESSGSAAGQLTLEDLATEL